MMGLVLRSAGRAVAIVLALLGVATAAFAQSGPPPPQLKKVADDLYFWFDFRGTNSAFWVTDDGVFVIDTQPHPVRARILIAEIAKVTPKPIRWAFNTQAHGDHYLGNSEFKKIGARIIAQAHAAFLMDKYWDKDFARRKPGFEKAGLDVKELVKVLPDQTFEDELVIRVGNRQVRLFYPGIGQDPGAAYAHFPHAKAVATSGSLTPRSLSNLMFTPSIDGWVKVLQQLKGMDADVYLPGHGDLGGKSDIDDTVGFLTTVQREVRAARAKGVPLAEAQKALTFEAYKSWRNYGRIAGYVRNVYVLEETGKPEYWINGWERK
jgi:glyoxylase-like metal-dependent hydrolase (beta-lactamase superfamily II)